MKKFIVALLLVSLIVGTTISASAAPADITKAKDKDLIYTYNFKGEDGVFTPDGSTNFKAAYTADVSEDGKAVTIKSIADAVPATNNRNLWGGTLEKLELTGADAYTLVYKAKANGAANADNILAVGGVLKAFSTLDSYSEILCNKGNYDTGAETMADTANFAFSMGNVTFGAATKASTLTKTIDVDVDGFMTMMVSYDGATNKIKAYVLSKDGSVKEATDWMEVWQANGNPGKLGFMVNAGTTVVDTTIKDARIYKGVGYGTDPEVEGKPGEGDNPGGNDNSGSSDTSGVANDGNTGSGSALSPKTGDTSPMIIFVILAAVLAIAGGMIAARRAYKR